MKIFVKSYHFGWEVPITAHGGFIDEDGDLVDEWCNHHGAKLENITFMGEDRYLCDHCGAQSLETINGIKWVD